MTGSLGAFNLPSGNLVKESKQKAGDGYYLELADEETEEGGWVHLTFRFSQP